MYCEEINKKIIEIILALIIHQITFAKIFN